MKAMVIYDSQYGNTGQIASAISQSLADSLGPDQVQALKVGDAGAEAFGRLELLVVGSPTHGFRPTSATRALLKSIPRNGLKGVRVAAFDTRITQEAIDSGPKIFGPMVKWFGYAAEPISKQLEKKGGQAAVPPEGYYVEDTEGPLSDGELERAAAWARRILASG